MTNKSLLENYIYSALFQVFRVISPVITIPYITRVLDSDGIGAFAYTNSIVNIFVMCGVLGINAYGGRIIAYNRDNFDKKSVLFWELFFLNLITNLIAFVIFIVFVQFSPEELKLLFYIQIFIFLTSIFETAWFFRGIEEFKVISARLFMTRLLGIIAIFAFVKTENDLPLYTFIISISGFIGCIFLWAQIKKEIKFVLPKIKNIFSHFVPTLNMFLPLIGAYLFVTIDKIMVGSMVGLEEAGIYEMGDRLIKVILPLIVSFTFVMSPRISNSIANKEFDKIDFYTQRSFTAISYLSIPICLGIMAISKEFTPWFMGENFSSSYLIMNILACTLILTAWRGIAGTQILIPFEKEKICALITLIGIIVKVAINFMVIPVYKGAGAAVSTVVAELLITIISIYVASSFVNLKGFYKEFLIEFSKFLVAGVVFYIPVRIVGFFMGAGVITTIVQVSIGVVLYLSLLAVLKSDTQKFVLDRFFKLIFKRRKVETIVPSEQN